MNTRNAKKKPAPFVDAPLTRADVIVRAARGRMRPDGGIEFSGALWVRDCPAGSFRNDGRGGCCTWTIRPEQQRLFDEFAAFANLTHPDLIESADWLAGLLWDEAMLRADGATPEQFAAYERDRDAFERGAS